MNSLDKIIINVDGACEPKNPGGVTTYAYFIRCGENILAQE